MANLKNAKKRILVNAKKAVRNNNYSASMKSAIKDVERAIAGKDKNKASEALKIAIKKIDKDGKPLSDVVFAVKGHSDKTTNEDGEITITVPITDTKKVENFEYEISEKEAKEGYDIVDGSATVMISCASELTGKDTDKLINTYTKTCTFSEEGDRAFKWDEKDLILTVVNNRSMAESLTIQKTVKGLSAEALADLEFTVSGPEDFGEGGKMTLKASEDCEISENSIICVVKDVPTGKYKVTESNADVERFELRVTGDDYNKEKSVKKNNQAVFKFTNEYEAIDPCADGEGCGGGDVPVVPPMKPDTGDLTLIKKGDASESMWVNSMIGGVASALTIVILLIAGVRRRGAKLTK